ncbi:MAG: DUF3108 domain-containing protein [Sulfuricella sp.]|nr:DUF3108 domain-containing protein [Sulfuricella sp.]
MKRLLVMLCSLWVGAAQAAAPLHTSAVYSFSKQGQKIGTVTETFRQSDGRYQLESVTTGIGIFVLLGKIRLASSGEVTDKGLRPLHFEDHRGAGKPNVTQVDFDWEKKNITFRFDGKTESIALEPGTQDRISMLYQFMFAPPKGDINLFMTSGKKLNQYQYKLAGEEKVTTPAGQFKAVHLIKQRTADEDGTEIWLAKDRRYFPVRIVIEERSGAKIEQNLISLSIEGE